MNRACTIYFSEDHYPRSYCCAWATDSTLQVGGEAYSQTMSHVRCMSMSVSLTGLRGAPSRHAPGTRLNVLHLRTAYSNFYGLPRCYIHFEHVIPTHVRDVMSF